LSHTKTKLQDIKNAKTTLGLVLLLSYVFICNGNARVAAQSYKDCKACPEMVVVPNGSYTSYSQKNINGTSLQHRISFKNPFSLSKFEITFNEWGDCVKNRQCSKIPNDHKWGRGTRPVINIKYSDIIEYLGWLSKLTGYTYRLPSESEWEYAAMAENRNIYSQEIKQKKGLVNCRDCGTKWSGIKSAPVGQFLSNSLGLHDMLGNVFEYVQDCWTKNRNPPPPNGLPIVWENCPSKVIKGGAWYYLSNAAHPRFRARNDINFASYVLGFRVLREMGQK
jgi:formylglycine-generating enzyme required for sulfatase activity